MKYIHSGDQAEEKKEGSGTDGKAAAHQDRCEDEEAQASQGSDHGAGVEEHEVTGKNEADNSGPGSGGDNSASASDEGDSSSDSDKSENDKAESDKAEGDKADSGSAEESGGEEPHGEKSDSTGAGQQKSGKKGFLAELFSSDPDSGELSEEKSGQQDMEASDGLGTEEPDRGGRKGFFARLFSDDSDMEDEEDGADGQDRKVQGDTDQERDLQEQKRKDKHSKSKKQAQQDDEESRASKDPQQVKRDKEQSNSLEESVAYWQGSDKISTSLEKTKETLTEVLGLGSSFDIVFREMSFGGQKLALLCISGFAKDTIIDEILKRLSYLTPDNVSGDVLASFMTEYIPHLQVEKGELLSEVINKVLSGMSVFFIEGESQVIVMDTRSYPSRSPDEPTIERVVRGARDGFTETLLSNVALVRRRVRDPGLKYEMHQVGRRTRTDVCIAYIDDIVDKTQVKAVTDKIKSVDIDGIPLSDKQLEEAIVGAGWNPYPMVRYSERPDVVASHLLEGRVVVFVDTSPSVMVLPTTFFDLCQHAEENRQTPFMGTYLRWVRFFGIFASLFLLPLWMLMVLHPELKPAMMEFIGPQKSAKIPLLAQFLIVELGVDLLRMAAVHTPTPLGSAMGLIAAIMVGDIAVQTGLFVNEVVLYMAVASIGMFATPSYELGLANRIVRLVLLIAVAAFQVQGLVIGTTLFIVLLTTHRSYNSSYLWPFIPFNAKAMGAIILRQPVLSSKTRPSSNKTRDNTRMPPSGQNKKQP